MKNLTLVLFTFCSILASTILFSEDLKFKPVYYNDAAFGQTVYATEDITVTKGDNDSEQDFIIKAGAQGTILNTYDISDDYQAPRYYVNVKFGGSVLNPFNGVKATLSCYDKGCESIGYKTNDKPIIIR